MMRFTVTRQGDRTVLVDPSETRNDAAVIAHPASGGDIAGEIPLSVWDWEIRKLQARGTNGK